MRIRISTITVYHTQSDSQSEQINQTIKIAMCYISEQASDVDFTKFLSAMKHVFNIKNKKLSIQQVSHFRIKQHVSLLVYKLELSSNMKIHSVISVINLELLLPSEDSYKCSYNDHSLPVKEENDSNIDEK